ncbi:MAG: DUF642 domain-containing protein [Pirellulales bacterium]
MKTRIAVCSFTGSWLFFLLVGQVNMSSANLITNGGFEIPNLDAGDYVTVLPGAEPLGFAWIVASGDVDVGNIPNAFVDFPAPEGANGLDLNGTVRGSLFQDFSTTPGQTYELSFLFTDNPFEAGISTADVSVSDVLSDSVLLSDSISHSTANNGTAAAGDGDPDTKSYLNSFVASGSMTRLTFTSTSASNSASGGVLIDAVCVEGSMAGLPGDGNGDGWVDGLDYLLWAGAYSTHPGADGDIGDGDYNDDGWVDGLDYLLWAGEYGNHAAAAVPEPTTAVLAVVGFSAWAVRRRRG